MKRSLPFLAAANFAVTFVPAVRAQTPPVRAEVTASDGHRLVVWSRRPAGAARGEILLLHGRTWSALPNFDLQVAGQQVSLMDALVAQGYAAYALDQRGYGSTPRDRTGWLTPDRAALDAVNVADWIAASAPGSRRPAVLGNSRGSATAMLAAQRSPAKFSALLMYGAYYNVEATPDLVPEPKSPPREKTTREGAAEDFITPASTPGGVKEAYIREAVRTTPIRPDWRHEEQFNALDPAKLRLPTLLINGERDPYARDANLPAMFARLAGIHRGWVVIANADHVAHLEKTDVFVRAITGFLEAARQQ